MKSIEDNNHELKLFVDGKKVLTAKNATIEMWADTVEIPSQDGWRRFEQGLKHARITGSELTVLDDNFLTKDLENILRVEAKIGQGENFETYFGVSGRIRMEDDQIIIEEVIPEQHYKSKIKSLEAQISELRKEIENRKEHELFVKPCECKAIDIYTAITSDDPDIFDLVRKKEFYVKTDCRVCDGYGDISRGDCPDESYECGECRGLGYGFIPVEEM